MSIIKKSDSTQDTRHGNKHHSNTLEHNQLAGQTNAPRSFNDIAFTNLPGAMPSCSCILPISSATSSIARLLSVEDSCSWPTTASNPSILSCSIISTWVSRSDRSVTTPRNDAISLSLRSSPADNVCICRSDWSRNPFTVSNLHACICTDRSSLVPEKRHPREECGHGFFWHPFKCVA